MNNVDSKQRSLSTKVNRVDLDNAIKDDYGVLYSPDGRRLLKCNNALIEDYSVREGTEVICDFAFEGCNFREKEEGGLIFFGDYGLSEINLPNSLISIGDYAFKDCKALLPINFPDRLAYIGSQAFSGCESLSSVFLPKGLRDVGGNPFDENLNTIVSYSPHFNVEDGLLIRGTKLVAVIDCPKHLTIPNSITSIGNFAFKNCIRLETIDYPDNLEFIGSQAFSGCKSCSSVILPRSLRDVGGNPFDKCLENIINYSPYFKVEGGLLIQGTKVVAALGNPRCVTIPTYITSIADYAFKDCSKLRIIGGSPICLFNILRRNQLPSRVESIGKASFLDCNKLKSLRIPHNVTSIGDKAFPRYTRLKFL